MILDGIVIFLGLLYMVLLVRKGVFVSMVFLIGAYGGLQAVYRWYQAWGTFFQRFFANEVTAMVIGSFLLFAVVAGVLTVAGLFAHGLTLLSLGDAFEPIIAFIFAFFGFWTYARFLLILAMTTGNPWITSQVDNSFLAHEIYYLEMWGGLVERLKPLTNPGPIYL